MKKVILLLCMASLFSSCYIKKYKMERKENVALRTQVNNLNNSLFESKVEATKATLHQIDVCHDICKYVTENNISYDEFKSKITGSQDWCENSTPNMKIPTIDVIRMISAYQIQRYNVINQVANDRIDGNQENYNANLYGKYKPIFERYFKNDKNKFVDSRAITFDLDVIQNFICQIKKKMIANGIDVKYFGGLRYYYIVYDSKVGYVNGKSPSNPKGVEKEHYNVHSLLIVPTITDPDTKKQIDFDPEITNKQKKGINSVLKLSTINPKQYPFINALVLKEDNGSLNIQNKGSLCPPPHSGCEGYDLIKLTNCVNKYLEMNNQRIENYTDDELIELFANPEIQNCLIQQ